MTKQHSEMRFGVTLPNFGDSGDARTLAGLARDAEAAGWDGFFLWDHVVIWPTPMVDPWIALTAIALATERIRLGPLVTPMPRRRPTKLARETVSLDHLSGGRLIFGVGIGDGPWEWEYFGEEPDQRVRGAMLDEGLALLTRLWSGEPVLHDGRFYTVRGDHGPGHPEIAPTPFLPAALQQPRIPVWVAGAWPRRAAFRRAAKWDGVVPMRYAQGLGQYLSPTEVGDIVAFIRQHRSGDDPFDVVSSGHTAGEDHDRDAALVRAHQDAGATWWLEDISPWPFGWAWDGPWPVERMQERIRQGPPRL